jgi:hypothetical protein
MTKCLDELGMKQPMTRRDFIGGVAAGVTLLAGAATDAAEPTVNVANRTESSEATVSASARSSSLADQYPPLRTGLRGH